MKIKIVNQNGITLTELLVASILIGIVMIGVASFSVSIGQLQNSTNRATILTMRTTAAMNHLTRAAYLAVGDETNRGVVPGGVGKKESICFRHDTDVDPSSYTGDTWTCYFINNQKVLWLCDPGLTPPVNNWGECKSGPGDPRELLDLENSNYFTIVNDTGAGPLEYININIPAIFNNQGGLVFHPIKNPRCHLHTQVRPPGHSG